jgi:hypothetical protein
MRLFASLIAAGLLMSSPALAQDDPNLRTPQLYEVVDGETRQQFVVGDGAWGDVLATIAAVRVSDEADSDAIVEQLWARRDLNPPIFLFEVARRLAVTDPERALEAYFLGRTRTIYDAQRCLDSTALTVIDAATNFGGEEITNVMAVDGERLERVIRRVQESGAAFGGLHSPWWACSYGEAAYFAAVNNAPLTGAEWLKTELVWEGIRDGMNNNMLGYLELIRAGIEAQAE